MRRSVALTLALVALVALLLVAGQVRTIAQGGTPAGGLQIGATPTRVPLQIGPTATPTPPTGVVGNGYISPTYGFTLTWDPSWTVLNHASTGGVDRLTLTNHTSTLGFTTTTAYGGDLTACRTALAARLAADPTNRNVVPAPDTSGHPLVGGDATRAWAVYLYTGPGASGKPTALARYLECRTVVPGRAMVEITDDVPADQFNAQASKLLTLLGNLIVANATAPAATGASPAAAAASPIAPPVTVSASPVLPAASPAASPPNTPAPTATASPSPSPSPTATPSPTSSPTPSPVPSPTATETPSPTPSPVPSPTASPTPSPVPSPTPSPTPNLPAAGVTGHAYTSPNYHYALTWNSAWQVEDATTAKGGASGLGFDQLALNNGTSRVTFTGSQDFGGNALACVQGIAGQLKAMPGVSDFILGVAADGQPIRSGNTTEAWAVYVFQQKAANGTTSGRALFLQCDSLVPGQAVLTIIQQVPTADFNAQIPARSTLLDALVLPATAPAAGTPGATGTPRGSGGAEITARLGPQAGGMGASERRPSA